MQGISSAYINDNICENSLRKSKPLSTLYEYQLYRIMWAMWNILEFKWEIRLLFTLNCQKHLHQQILSMSILLVARTSLQHMVSMLFQAHEKVVDALEDSTKLWQMLQLLCAKLNHVASSGLSTWPHPEKLSIGEVKWYIEHIWAYINQRDPKRSTTIYIITAVLHGISSKIMNCIITRSPLVHCGCTGVLRGLWSTVRATSSRMAKPARRIWAEPCSSCHVWSHQRSSLGEMFGFFKICQVANLQILIQKPQDFPNIWVAGRIDFHRFPCGESDQLYLLVSRVGSRKHSEEKNTP